MLIVITVQGGWMMAASTVETMVAESGAYAVIRVRLDTRGQSLARVVAGKAISSGWLRPRVEQSVIGGR